ncbi:hypothetical protein [Hymenobacter ruber]
MALPIPAPDTATIRFSLIQGSRTRVCQPRLATGGGGTLVMEPGESSNAGPFYYRKKLSKGLIFTGNDYLFLLGIEQSNARCQSIGLLLETRPHSYANFEHEEQFVFTCNEIAWDYNAGTATVTPATDDAYRVFLENYDQEYNILATPNVLQRAQVTAELATLASYIFVEFQRIDIADQADYIGTDGWGIFLTNTSWITGTLTQGGRHDSTMLLFRYRLKNVPMTAATSGGVTSYTIVDKSGAGWQVLQENTTPAHTVDYVKSPSISGFKSYKITNYGNWNDPDNPASLPIYGDQLLLLPCYTTPNDYGYDQSKYLKITGTGEGQSLGGAYNSEADGGLCLNVRRTIDQGGSAPSNSKSLWWKFGTFAFGRCFPLLDGVRYLLQQTAMPVINGTAQPIPAVAALIPPTAALLSQFYSADANPATGETGTANELPRLLLSAASDVKRYGASEAATRLLISLKTLLSDLSALHDVGWFIDPVTGWLRLEHRAYVDNSRAAGAVLDLTAIETAQLPAAYTYRTGQLPRYEELTITAATTEDLDRGIFFGKASLDYGTGGCVNTREGQNKTTRTSTRLTGDVAAAVLSGDTIPDSALVLLAPDTNGVLTDANRQLSASELLRRYHGFGAATYSATVAGQAVDVQSVRPAREQASCSVPMCTLRGLDGTTRLTTSLGIGGQIGKAELDLNGGTVKFTPWMPTPAYTADAPALPTRDFSEQFTEKFS